MERMKFNIYPYIEDGDLVIETSLEDSDLEPVRLKLEQLFTDFLEYRREMFSSELSHHHRPEVVDTIALLRHIAREMEVEIDGTTH